MLDKKMIAMLMTLSMLAASLAGCLGGDDEDPVEEWELMPAADITADIVTSAWDPIIPNLNDPWSSSSWSSTSLVVTTQVAKV